MICTLVYLLLVHIVGSAGPLLRCLSARRPGGSLRWQHGDGKSVAAVVAGALVPRFCWKTPKLRQDSTVHATSHSQAEAVGEVDGVQVASMMFKLVFSCCRVVHVMLEFQYQSIT